MEDRKKEKALSSSTFDGITIDLAASLSVSLRGFLCFLFLFSLSSEVQQGLDDIFAPKEQKRPAEAKRARKNESGTNTPAPSFSFLLLLLNLDLFLKKKKPLSLSADRPLRLHPDHPRPGHAVHGAQAEPGAAAVADVKKNEED